jgi:hypothetical protein
MVEWLRRTKKQITGNKQQKPNKKYQWING